MPQSGGFWHALTHLCCVSPRRHGAGLPCPFVDMLPLGFAYYEVVSGGDGRPDIRCLYLNAAYERLLGLRGRDLLGRTAGALGLPVDPERTARCARVAAGGGPENAEEQSGGRVWSVHAFSPKRGFVGVLYEDITERRRAEEEAARAGARFRSIAEASADLIYRLDLEGRITYASPAARSVLGCAPEDLIGRSCFELAEPEFQDRARAVHRAVREGLAQRRVEIRARRHDGASVDLEMTCVPVIDGGTIIGEQGVLRDVSAARRAERALRDALDHLHQTQAQVIQAEKLATIGLLAAGVAHEINNPLGFIESNLTVLEDHLDGLRAWLDAEAPDRPADIDEILRDSGEIVRESREGFERIRRIVQDLRTFSRADTGESSDLNLNEVVDGVLRIVRNEIRYKVDLVREEGALPQVHGNARQLGQVFLNILVNAVQSMPGRGRLVVRTFVHGGESVVEIEDSGQGMTREVAAHIFDPFFTTKPPGMGTGLGLSISYDIVKRHGGRIQVRTAPGEGSCFTVAFPAVAVPDKGMKNG